MNPDDRPRIATESLPQIDQTVVAERENGFSGPRVDLLQKVVHREDQPAILPVLALPIRDAARGESWQVLVDPDLPACGGVERNERTVARLHVHHVVDDNRVEDVGAVVAGGIGPGDFQLVDIRLVDLLQIDVVRRIRPAAVILPGFVVLTCVRDLGDRDEDEEQQRRSHRKGSAPHGSSSLSFFFSNSR